MRVVSSRGTAGPGRKSWPRTGSLPVAISHSTTPRLNTSTFSVHLHNSTRDSEYSLRFWIGRHRMIRSVNVSIQMLFSRLEGKGVRVATLKV